MITIHKCIICGSNNFKVIFKENDAQIHQIVKCVECGLMFANPQKHIDSDLHSNEHKQLQPITINDHTVQKNYNQITDYESILSFINTMKPNKGKLLEVGSYVGVFLNFLKSSGWDVVGVEPNSRAVDYAKKHFQLNLLHTTLESSLFNNEPFDVVIMTHVIEHLKNPVENLLLIHRILKEKGILVLETPTYDTLMFRMLGRRERSISCDGHLFFFTQMSLKRLLEQNGFRIIQQELVGRTLSLERLLWNIGVISKSNLIKNFIENISNFLKLKKIVIHLNMRDMQRVYCIKI